MDRHITHLIKKSLEDVDGAEFRMFVDFLNGLSFFGEKAPKERIVELSGSIEGQADLDAQFNLPDEHRLDQLKALAEVAPFTKPKDLCQILPVVVQLLKKTMPRRKSGEEFNFTYVECLLYTFRYLADKVFGFPITSGEDFTEQNEKFTERLYYVEELTRASMKKLIPGMAEKNKVMAAAKSDEAKDCSSSPKEKHGTCIITLVGRRGIYTAADGRLTSNLEADEGLVVGGDCIKLVTLSKRLLITTAGNKGHCDDIINHLRLRVKGTYNIRVVKKIVNRYLEGRKKRDPEEVFLADVDIFGYYHGKTMVYMSTSESKCCQKLKFGYVVASGTGSWFAANYISSNPFTGKTREEYFQYLEKAVAFAAFHDSNSGGHAWAAEISNRRGKEIHMELRNHVSKILRTHFNRLRRHMAVGFLVVSWDLPYSCENEKRVRAILTEKFHTERPYNLNVLTVDITLNIITRVMFFTKNPSDLLMLVKNNRILYESSEFTVECFWPTADNFPQHLDIDDL